MNGSFNSDRLTERSNSEIANDTTSIREWNDKCWLLWRQRSRRKCTVLALKLNEIDSAPTAWNPKRKWQEVTCCLCHSISLKSIIYPRRDYGNSQQITVMNCRNTGRTLHILHTNFFSSGWNIFISLSMLNLTLIVDSYSFVFTEFQRSTTW